MIANLCQFKKITGCFFLVLISLILVFVGGLDAKAAVLKLESGAGDVNLGQDFEVEFVIDSQGESINALEAEIIFPADLFSLKEMRDGNSIVNFWIEKPSQVSAGRVKFSGVTPGGYYGQAGRIFSLVLSAEKIGHGWLQIKNAQVLKNDGKGTKAKLSIINYQLSILEIKETQNQAAQQNKAVEKVIDEEPPESFNPQIGSSPNMFEGKWFLAFSTQDKGSGIDYYEVKEGRRQFKTAESPYVLENQNLDVEVKIKAVDKSGNKRIIELAARYPKKWYENYWIWSIIVVVSFLLFGVLIKFGKRNKGVRC